jgi:hypothetical protein
LASGEHVKFTDVEFFETFQSLHGPFNRVVLAQNKPLSTGPAARISLLNKGEAWVLADIVKGFEIEYIAVFEQV